MGRIDPQTQKLDAVLALLAGRQHGVVAREQLLAAGVSPTVIRRRLASGGLIPIHPGVYLVGHRALSPLAHEAAAILACRPRALLSHITAARLWRLPVPSSDEVHVTVVGRSRRSLSGVRVHSITALPRAELHRHEGLPLSSPSLTMLDLAGIGTGVDVAAALNEARVQRIVTAARLRATLDHHPNRRGAKALRALLDGERGPTITRSEAERLALRIMRRHGIEPDGSNVRIGPFRVDFWFERERVVVEIDGYRFHSTPRRFVDDRRRAAALAARGLQVLPLSWHDLVDRPGAAMRDLAATLECRRAQLARSRR